MPLIQQANLSSPSFAQIAKEMCVLVNTGDGAKTLPKSSKGTIQRGVAYEVFKDEIEALYGASSSSETVKKRTLEEIEQYLLETIKGVAGMRRKTVPLDRTTDLFSWGVDSLMASRIRTAAQRVSV